MSDLYNRTDWDLLRQQKAALVICDMPEELKDGLLSFIDAIQDDADSRGYPVFPAEDEDGE